MRLPQAFLFLLTLFTTIHALALPASLNSISDSAKELFKRKGGGGGGGRGGGGGGSSGGGRSSGGGGSSSGRTGTNSNVGGATSRGSGPQPSYGGGRYYGGGATVPYAAGARSRGGIGPAPLFLGGAALVAFPGIWLYGAYAYGYPYYWTYRNNTSGQNETHPAQCLCAARASCGCDDQVNSTEYQNSVANDKSVAQLARINDTDTLVINGTLPNGTTAAGGTDDDESAAFGMKQGLAQAVGYWPLVAGVAYTMWFM